MQIKTLRFVHIKIQYRFRIQDKWFKIPGNKINNDGEIFKNPHF